MRSVNASNPFPNNTLPQKFRLYVLETEKGTDIVAYLLAYFIDIKDKPRK